MPERQHTTVTLHEQDIYGSAMSSEYEADDLAAFIQFLQYQLDQVPAEYRDSAKIEIGCDYCYDSANATIEVYYTRPETDEEMDARVNRKARWQAEADAKDRKHYEALKKRFEG
jgi:hypothetical protein